MSIIMIKGIRKRNFSTKIYLEKKDFRGCAF
jgi:hypothetical protein